ncbi:MAG: CRISPR-associated endonuclease Cas2 [Nitrospirota bacterium]
MFVMVSYDIKDDLIRRKVQKILEGFGERVQYSVFECLLTDSQYKNMKNKVQVTLMTVMTACVFTYYVPHAVRRLNPADVGKNWMMTNFLWCRLNYVSDNNL